MVSFITEVNAEGIIKGLAIGHSKIYARAVGINPTTGQKVIYSEVIGASYLSTLIKLFSF